jgi:hypothetical protein
MKKTAIAFVLIFLFLIPALRSNGKECFGYFNLAGANHIAPFFQPAISFDTLIDPGTTINLPVSITLFGQGSCTCTADSAWWIYNGNLISNSPNYTITDTGVYYIYQNALGDPGCDYTSYAFSLTLHVAYRSTNSVSELSPQNLVQIYPTISTGIFHVKTDAAFHINKISVRDDTGRIIYSSSTNLSEIDLSNYAVGVYIYQATDDKGHFSRGKLIIY